MKSFYRFLLVIFFFFSPVIWYHVRSGFCFRKCLAPVSFSQVPNQYECSSLEKEQLEHVFSQPFFFVGKEKKYYAFLSKDQNFICKVLRTSKQQAPFWCRFSFIEPYFATKKRQKNKEKQDLLESILYTKQHYQEQAGIVFSHEEASFGLQLEGVFVDLLARKHRISLDALSFIVQKNQHVLWDEPTKDLSFHEQTENRSLISSFFEDIGF